MTGGPARQRRAVYVAAALVAVALILAGVRNAFRMGQQAGAPDRVRGTASTPAPAP